MTIMDHRFNMDIQFDDTHQQLQQIRTSSTSSSASITISSNGSNGSKQTTPPAMTRKVSRKMLERKSNIDYDDVIDESAPLTPPPSALIFTTTTNEEYFDDENEMGHVTNNSVFDELFETAAASIQPDMQYSDQSYNNLIQRKSSSRASVKSMSKNRNTNPTPSPTLSINKTRSSENMPNRNYLSLKDAESYLGAPQPLTRSCSCKRPASIKRMRSKSSINGNNNFGITLRVDPLKSPTNVDLKQQEQQQNAQNRAASLPFENFDMNSNPDFYRLRCFNITSKGAVINRGDSFKRSFKRSSNHSMRQKKGQQSSNDNISNGSATNAVTSAPPIVLTTEAGYHKLPTLLPIQQSINSSQCETSNVTEKSVEAFSVYILGGLDVGKTSLTKQFKTSEYRGTYDITITTSIEDDVDESVPVMLDGVESNLIFTPVDIDNVKQVSNTVLEQTTGRAIDAYIVCYSIIDKTTLQTAVEILKTIRISENKSYPIILVGNKSDLARKRAITRDEGRNVALKYSCKFVETSVAINDKVDDLLAGVLKQIRLNSEQISKQTKSKSNSNENTNKIKNRKKIFSILKKSTNQEQNTKKSSTSFFRKLFCQVGLFSNKRNKPSGDSVENLFTLPN